MSETSAHNPSLRLLVKLGSLIVHTDEMLSSDGREVDKHAVKELLADPEVVQWIKDMDCMLPRKRVGKDYDDRGTKGAAVDALVDLRKTAASGSKTLYVSNSPKARAEGRDKSWYDEEARRDPPAWGIKKAKPKKRLQK